MSGVAYPVARERGWRLTIPWESVVGIITVVSVVYLVGSPLFMLLFSSVRSTQDRLPFEATAFTLDNFTGILGSPDTYRLLGNTLTYAVGTVLVSLSLAVAFSFLIERTTIPLRSSVLAAVLAPMALPPFVAAFAWTLLANPANGTLNLLIRGALGLSGRGPLDAYTIPAMILITGTILVPGMYVMVSGTFARMDPALEEAARLSGVSWWKTLRHVTLPLLRPGIVGAAIFYFIVAMETFELPAILGIPGNTFVLSTWIYFLIHRTGSVPDYGLASGYAVLVMIAAGALIFYYGKMVRQKERFVTVTGRGYRTQLIDLGKWRYPVFAAVAAYFLVVIVLPLGVLIWKSVGPPYGDFSLAALGQVNFKMYVKAIGDKFLFEAVRNTAVISVVTATATMVLATMMAWLSVRSGFRAGSFPERVAFLAQGVPSVIAALAIMFFYVSIPLPIYATLWIIVIALVTRFIPYGSRVMYAAYLQLHRELEEASWTSGVAWLWTMRGVVLPLIWPSFFRGWLWAFIHALRDATIPLMLISAGNETVSTRLWFQWMAQGEFQYASAIAVMLMLVSAFVTYFVARQTLLEREGRD
ncbi:MAG: iron ABC transporter permease [Chloroflexi bacterium]|nr:iron ABC transporter permease [Chloroflexota bacterium]